MKTQWSHTKISPFGGVVPILRKLQELKIPELIGSCLGQRVKQAKYSNENILTSWVLTQLTSGFRLLKIEDTEKEFSSIPELNIPSHDTMGRFFKKLATPSQDISYRSPKSNSKSKPVNYKYCENLKLNELLIQSAIAMNLINTEESYTLDIDMTLIPSEVRDAVPNYKKYMGFAAMVCSIGKIPIYIDIRSGNSSSNFKLVDALKNSLDLLKKYNIKIDRVRSDGAGYQHDFLKYVDSEKIKFNVGADGSVRAEQRVEESGIWRKLKFETSNHIWDAEFASAPYTLSRSEEEYILVAIRVKKEERHKIQPTKWKLIDNYYYKFIVTNDEQTSPHRLFEEYHQRGAIEKIFDELKNDFGWRIVPFSNINENLVYLQMTAFTSIIYQGLLQIYSKEFEKIKPTIRLEKFQKQFIRAFAFAYIEGVLKFFGEDLDFQKIV